MQIGFLGAANTVTHCGIKSTRRNNYRHAWKDLYKMKARFPGTFFAEVFFKERNFIFSQTEL